MKVYHKYIHFKNSVQDLCYHYFDIAGNNGVRMFIRLTSGSGDDYWWDDIVNFAPTKIATGVHIRLSILRRIFNNNSSDFIYFLFRKDLNQDLLTSLLGQISLSADNVILSHKILGEYEVIFTPTDWELITEKIILCCQGIINTCKLWSTRFRTWDPLHETGARSLTRLMVSSDESKT